MRLLTCLKTLGDENASLMKECEDRDKVFGVENRVLCPGAVVIALIRARTAVFSGVDDHWSIESAGFGTVGIPGGALRSSCRQERDCFCIWPMLG